MNQLFQKLFLNYEQRTFMCIAPRLKNRHPSLKTSSITPIDRYTAVGERAVPL